MNSITSNPDFWARNILPHSNKVVTTAPCVVCERETSRITTGANYVCGKVCQLIFEGDKRYAIDVAKSA